MELDPVFLTAVVAAVGSAYTVWRTSRAQEKTTKVTAQVDGVKMTAEFDFKKEEMLNESVKQHLDRLEAQIVQLTERVTELEAERRGLEEERVQMLAWMAHNQLDWPPPRLYGAEGYSGQDEPGPETVEITRE